MPSWRVSLVVAGWLLFALPSVALAQNPATDAEQKFDQGLADMNAGRYSTACPALAESFRLDPQPGALFTLAECEAAWGKIARAVGHYDDYLQLFGSLPASKQTAQGARVKVATDQINLLKPNVPLLTLALDAAAPRGTVVMLDGVVVDASSLGVPVPVDPGEHVASVRTPDGKTEEVRVMVARGARARQELHLPAARAELQKSPSNAPLAAPRSDSSGWNTAAVVTGAIGLVGLGVGATTAGLALSAKSTIDEHCNDHTCDPDGLDAVDRGQSMAMISTVALIAGGAGVLATAVLLIAKPSASARRAFDGQSRGLASLALQGSGRGAASFRW